MPIRFHLDQHVAGAVADGLRRRNIDVTTSRDADLLGANDVDHLTHIREQGRVMVTMDADFLRLHASGEAHPGIVYCEMGKRSVGELLDLLVILHSTVHPEQMHNHIEFF